MALEVEPQLIQNLTDEGGGLVLRADPNPPLEVVTKALLDLYEVRHPEEPDESAISYVSEVKETDNGFTFWFDYDDFDELLPPLIAHLVASLEGAGVNGTLGFLNDDDED